MKDEDRRPSQHADAHSAGGDIIELMMAIRKQSYQEGYTAGANATKTPAGPVYIIGVYKTPEDFVIQSGPYALLYDAIQITPELPNSVIIMGHPKLPQALTIGNWIDQHRAWMFKRIEAKDEKPTDVPRPSGEPEPELDKVGSKTPVH